MIISKQTGKIAFHSIRLQDNGPAKFVQYDFQGKVLYEKPLSDTKAEDYRQEVNFE